MTTKAISSINYRNHVISSEELGTAQRISRFAKRWFDGFGDGIRSGLDRLHSTSTAENTSWADGRQLSNGAMEKAIDSLHEKYPNDIKILKGVVNLDIRMPMTADSIKEGLGWEIQAELNGSTPKIVAIPVRINGGSHIGLLAFDTEISTCVWYDARTSTPRSAKIMTTDLTVEQLAQDIWNKISNNSLIPRLQIFTNRSKDQHDFFNCGIHVIDAMEELAKNKNLFKMVKRAHDLGDQAINGYRHALAEELTKTSSAAPSSASSTSEPSDDDWSV